MLDPPPILPVSYSSDSYIRTYTCLLFRKYRRLEVRYSRLATSGVTFDPSSDDEEPVEVAPTESEHTSTGVTVFHPTHPPDPDQ